MSELDYFTLLGLEKKYDIDLKLLEKNYFMLQNKYHPDKVASLSARDIAIASQINNAYKTLKDSVARAEYILKLAGVDVNSDEQSKFLSQEILIKALEDREYLENANNKTDIAILLELKSKYKNDLLLNLASNLKQEKIHEAANNALELKYVSKLINEIKQKIEECN